MPSKKTILPALRYEELARVGKNNWWRYVFSILLIVAGNFLLSFPFIILLFLRSLDLTQLQQAIKEQDTQRIESMFNQAGNIDLFADYTSTLLVVSTAAITFFLMWAAIRWIHHRPLTTLITTRTKLDWRRVWTGTWVYGSILIMITAVSYLIQYTSYHSISISLNSFNLLHYTIFLVILIPLVFLQVMAEELVFRGYIFQTAHLATENILTRYWKNKLPRVASLITATTISTTLFGLAHFTNTPFRAGIFAALTYFLSALFFQIITIKDQRLELAIGVHFVNNLLAFAVIGSALEGGNTSIFVDNAGATDFNTLAQVVVTAIPFLLFYYIVFSLLPRLTKSQNKV